MKIYCVEQKYFNNGNVQVSHRSLDLPAVPASSSQEYERYDLYIDYFTDPVEAEKFMRQALRA